LSKLFSGTQKHAAVRKWLSKRERIHVHFAPTSLSWLDMAQRYFCDITEKRIRRGVFKSVSDLESAIHACTDNHNEAPNPFIWTANPADILAKAACARKALDDGCIPGGLP
jgi:hypothetical protein